METYFLIHLINGNIPQYKEVAYDFCLNIALLLSINCHIRISRSTATLTYENNGKFRTDTESHIGKMLYKYQEKKIIIINTLLS